MTPIKYKFAPGEVHSMRDESGRGLMECKRILMRQELEAMLSEPCSNEKLRRIMLEIFKVFTQEL